MIKSLRKIFGVNDDQQAVAPAALPRARALRGHSLITHSLIGQTIVVTIVERELNVNTAADVCWEIKDLYEHSAGVRHVILDMENIKFVDSAGLNQLVDLLSAVKKRQGRLGIASATQHVEVLFKLTRLELVFTIRRTVIEAIDAIEPKG
jgi:anti-sigma B factor antagonist